MLVKIIQNVFIIFCSLTGGNAFASGHIGDFVPPDTVSSIGTIIGGIVSTIIIRLLESLFRRKRLNDKVAENTTETYTLAR